MVSLFSFGSACNIFILPFPVTSAVILQISYIKTAFEYVLRFPAVAEENFSDKCRELKFVDQTGIWSSVQDDGYKYKQVQVGLTHRAKRSRFREVRK